MAPYRSRWIRETVGALVVCVTFAIVGSVLETRVLARAMLPHIILSGDTSRFQGIAEGLPTPRLLVWNSGVIEWLAALASMPGALAIALNAVIGSAAFFVAAGVLNPTFRPIRLVPTRYARPEPQTDSHEGGQAGPLAGGAANKARNRRASLVVMEGLQLGRALNLLLWFGVPVGLLWIVEDASHSVALRLVVSAVTGGALWVGFARDGIAGDYGAPGPGPAPSAILRLALTGGVAGLLVCELATAVSPISLPALLLRYQTLGTFNRAFAGSIGAAWMLTVAACWFASAALLVAMGYPTCRDGTRVVFALIAVLSAGYAYRLQRPFAPSALGERLDITPAVLVTVPSAYNPAYGVGGVPDGARAAHELAIRAGIASFDPRPDRTVLLFTGAAAFPVVAVRQRGFTEDDLTTAAESAQRVRAFLQRRRFRTALSWVAIKHLFNVATVHFDATSALNACMLDMTRCPHAFQCDRVVAAMLFTLPATRANLGLLDEYAAASSFAHTSRFSKRLLGDLYLRFGRSAGALRWYRRAEMPRTFMDRVARERPMFHGGGVTGVITLDGRPLPGVQVGVVPRRMNGLPPSLRPLVLHCADEVVQSGYSYKRLPAFPPFHPGPFAFRWVVAGATTDITGRFKIEDLVEGQYMLVCTLPPAVRVRLPSDPGLQIANSPRPFTVDYGRPTANLGAIAMRYHGNFARRGAADLAGHSPAGRT